MIFLVVGLRCMRLQRVNLQSICYLLLRDWTF